MTDRNNARATASIDVDVSLLPALVDALAIARNTALLCGHEASKTAFENLRVLVLSMTPFASKGFQGNSWTEAMLGAADGVATRVETRQIEYWRAKNGLSHHVAIRIDGQRMIESEQPMSEADAESLAAALRAHIEMISPLAP